MLKIPALKGIYRYHEFLGPVIPLDFDRLPGRGAHPGGGSQRYPSGKGGDAVFSLKMTAKTPAPRLKDRGMASALSYINFLIQTGQVGEVLSICASTGDTSAAAALYAAYLKPHIKIGGFYCPIKKRHAPATVPAAGQWSPMYLRFPVSLTIA